MDDKRLEDLFKINYFSRGVNLLWIIFFIYIAIGYIGALILIPTLYPIMLIIIFIMLYICIYGKKKFQNKMKEIKKEWPTQ